MDHVLGVPGPASSRRRSQRILLNAPVTIRGVHKNNQPFTEDTKTLAVNAHGALIVLSAHVVQGQVLVLKHVATGEEQEIKVVYIGKSQGGKSQVGVEFTKPAPSFWHVSFPPEDWSPRHPDARTRKSS